jgi:DNA polymerase-3 subunit delta
MEISRQQLPQHIKRKLAPVYLLSGDEHLLIDEAILSIREEAKKLEFSSRGSFMVQQNFSWEALALELNNLSLFTEKSIVELRIGNAKIGDVGSLVLQNYAANPSKDKLLIIIADKLDASIKKTKWYENVNAVGVLMQVWPLDQNQFRNWIANKLREHNVTLEDDGLNLLIDHVEGNLLAASQEIVKLKMIYGEGLITLENLVRAITEVSDFDVYDLAASAFLGEPKKVIKILDRLKGGGSEPAIILWAITRELRIAISVFLKMEKGEDLEQIFLQQKIKPSQKIALKKILQRHKLNQLEKMLILSAKIDFLIKGAIEGNVWRELSELLLLIAK